MSKDAETSAAAQGPLVAHRFLVALLHSPFGRLLGGLCELRFAGRISGRTISLPVQCVREGPQLVIYVRQASDKRWWRNFLDGRDVQVRVAGVGYRGHGHVIDVGHRDRAWAEQAYHGRYPRVELLPIDPMVVIDLDLRTSQEMARDRVRGE